MIKIILDVAEVLVKVIGIFGCFYAIAWIGAKYESRPQP